MDSSGPSSYRQSSRFYSFNALPRGGWCEGVLLYISRKSVGSSALRAFFASNPCFTLDGPLSKRVSVVGLSWKPPKLRSWHCTQPRAAKATADVAVVGKMASITRATAIVWYTLLASGARSAPRWLAERSNSIDSQGSAVVWYCCVVPGTWVCERGGVYFVVGWAMRWVQNERVTFLLTGFFD